MRGQIPKGWQYYNHAMIPTTAPHEEVDLSPVVSGEIWNYRNGKEIPLFVTRISEWDCGYKTDWWYVICEGTFSLDNLSSSSRRNIRKALRNCRVERIDPSQYIEDLWRVFNEAIERYENYAIEKTKDAFSDHCRRNAADEEYWAGFDNNTGLMIGYAVFIVHDNWVKFDKSRYSTPYLKLRVSDAINAKALDYYLNEMKKRYVSDGTRSILHKTNFQKYLMEHFGYRKAYCKLHIRYRYSMRILVNFLILFREYLRMFDGNAEIHRINGVLLMEEIVKKQNVFL